jgi:hypothetical protein
MPMPRKSVNKNAIGFAQSINNDILPFVDPRKISFAIPRCPRGPENTLREQI